MDEATPTTTTQPAAPRRPNFLQVRIPKRDQAFAAAVANMAAAVGEGRISAAVRKLVIERFGDAPAAQ